MNPFVSIIIANYNGKQFLSDCLMSLKNQTYKNFEIVFVDNGSDDGSVEYVKTNFPEIKLIKNERNLGFAKANNQGFEMAEGEFIVTLNNDTRTEPNWLNNLVCAAIKDEKIGMCASKIVSMQQKNILDSTGVLLSLDGMSKGRGRLERDGGQYDNNVDILLPSACAALYKRKMITEVGFFDDDFFAYCEDTDLGLRGRLAGWKAVFVPGAVVYHYYSGTGGKYSSFKAFLIERNHVWLAVKNFPMGLLILFPFLTFYRLVLQVLAMILKRGATGEFSKKNSFYDSASIVFRAYFDAIKKISEMFKKRKDFKKMEDISGKNFFSLLKMYRLSFRKLIFKR